MTTSEQRIVPVILSGGGGTRLWPISRHDRPKQFLPLLHGQSTFSRTVARIANSDIYATPWIITSTGSRGFVVDELQQAGVAAHIVLEPVRRDSAAAIAVAALLCERAAPGSLLLVLAADHVVKDVAAFTETVLSGCKAAVSGCIVTFGIKPDRPSSSYGYIEPGAVLQTGSHRIKQFVEKPDTSRAKQLIEEGCLWNSGNFLLRSDIILGELASFEPGILAAATAAVEASTRENEAGLEFHRLAEQAFAASPAKSFDYAIMERTSKAAVILAKHDWSDLGSFDTLWNAQDRDAAGNLIAGDALLQDSRGCYVSSEGLFTAVVGLNDVAVVATPDAVLVAPRSIGAELRQVTEALEASPQRRRLVRHHEVRRFARSVETKLMMDEGVRLSVVRLDAGASMDLEPGAAGTLQLSVLRGSGNIASGSRLERLRRGATTRVPAGELSKVSNTEDSALEFLLLELSPV